jgi:hypothetical protein
MRKKKIQIRKETHVQLRWCSKEALDSFKSLDAASVNGNLNLSGCTGPTKLPDGLIVGGFLYLGNCTGLKKLPDGLMVNGDLNLYGCSELTKLPDGLRVIGDLDLCYCPGIKDLPADLIVDGVITYDSDTGFYGRVHVPGVIPKHLKNKLHKY